MRSRAWFVAVLILVAAASTCGATPPQITINIAANTLGTADVASLTIDDVTELLGRPSATTDPKVIDDTYFGPRLYYHDYGLCLSFGHPDVDAERHCMQVVVHLVREYDDDHGVWFSPFVGELASGVTGDWKADQVMEAFVEQSPRDQFDQEKVDKAHATVQRFADMGMGGPGDERFLKAITGEIYSIKVEWDDHSAVFKYEPNTRFVNAVILTVAD